MRFGEIRVIYIHVAKQYDFTNGQSMMVKLHTIVLDPNVLSKCTRYNLESFVAIDFIKYETMSQKYPVDHYDIVAKLTYAVINSVMKLSYKYRLGVSSQNRIPPTELKKTEPQPKKKKPKLNVKNRTETEKTE